MPATQKESRLLLSQNEMQKTKEMPSQNGISALLLLKNLALCDFERQWRRRRFFAGRRFLFRRQQIRH